MERLNTFYQWRLIPSLSPPKRVLYDVIGDFFKKKLAFHFKPVILHQLQPRTLRAG